MKLPEFIFLSSKEFKGFDLILKTREPYEVFRAFKFENGTDLENFVKKYNLLNDCIIMDDYYILIAYIGDIAGVNSNYLPLLGHNVALSTKHTFAEIKQFYNEERIKGNETRLKKYRAR